MSATFEFNDSRFLSALNKKIDRATALLAKRVLDDSNIFIPLDTGELRASGRVEPDKAVTWNTPYGQKVYYPERTGIHIHTEKNPNATGHWFEVAKSLKLPEWVQLFGDNIK